MAYTAAELSGPLLLGDDKSIYYYDAEDASDAFATVAASGYFNNTDDNLRMAVGDVINVKATDGYGVLEVASLSSGAVVTEVVNGDSVVEAGTTSNGLSSYGTSVLDTAGTYAMDTGPLNAGQHKFIANEAGAVTITSTGGAPVTTTGGNLIFRKASGVHLVASSTSRWAIVSTAAYSSTGLGNDVTTS